MHNWSIRFRFDKTVLLINPCLGGGGGGVKGKKW